MKKLLSLAIAAAVAAPMAVSADTTIYGLMDFNLSNIDDGTTDAWDLRDGNGSSRLGVKGSEDLGNGMKAIFQYEWSTGNDIDGDAGGTFNSGTNGANNGLSTRVAKVGLSGGFGTVALGRMWTPFYMATAKANVFDMDGGTWASTTVNTSTRYGNSVKYSTPNFSGFSAEAMFTFSNDDTSGAYDGDDSVDATSLGVHYNNGPLSVGLGYEDREMSATTDRTSWGLSGKYNFGNFAVVAAYQDDDNAGVDSDSFQLAGQAYFGNNTVTLSYGEQDAVTDIDKWQIGFRHAFSKRTRVYAEYSQADAGAVDTDIFGVGLRHDF